MTINIPAILVRMLQDKFVCGMHITWLNLNTALVQLHATEAMIRNTAEAYDLDEARCKIGSSSILEVSDLRQSRRLEIA